MPGTGEALVRVRACSVNHLDIWVREGNPAYKIDLPHVLGSDIAGEVAGFGPGTATEGVKAGDKVVVSPGVSCWDCPACRSGKDNLCDTYAILGADGGWGGYAEYAVVPARSLLPLPGGLSFEEAASFPLAYLTAYHMLKSLARLAPGETLLVLGAGSGVGAAAVQLGKALGAAVVAASSSEAKLSKASELGADSVFAVPDRKLARAAKRALGTSRPDVIFDHIGGEFTADSIRLLATGGRLVTCGATAGHETKVDLRHVFFKELSVLGAKMGTLAELKEVCGLLSGGALRPVVDAVFPLAEAPRAHAHLQERRQFGKVVLRP